MKERRPAIPDRTDTRQLATSILLGGGSRVEEVTLMRGATSIVQMLIGTKPRKMELVGELGQNRLQDHFSLVA